MASERMPWFKWWGGTAADMKFRMVAEDCKLPVACIVGAWAYILEHASHAEERGSIAGLDLELMGYTLQLPDPETVCNALKRRKLIDEDGYVAKWENRQGKRERSEAPGASTERVRRMREKQKQNKNNDLGGNGGSNDDETDVTARNGTQHPKKKRKNKEEEVNPPTPLSAGADGDGGEEGKEPEPPKPFDQFWEAYPHKVDKIEARKVWAKLKPDAELVAKILAAVEAQKSGDQWMRDNGQYIPGPARWLRGGRWLDEVRAYVAPPPKLPPGWWETKEGMAAAGKMLDPPLTPMPGEYPKDFAQRIRVALGQVDQPPARAQDAAPPAAPYVPPAPPPEVQLTPEQQEARREEFREAMAKLKQRAGQAGVPGSP